MHFLIDASFYPLSMRFLSNGGEAPRREIQSSYRIYGGVRSTVNIWNVFFLSKTVGAFPEAPPLTSVVVTGGDLALLFMIL